MSRSWTLTIVDAPLMTMNERLHWSVRARRARELRQTAAWIARSHRIPPLERVRVEVAITPLTNRRRDADNYVPVLKHIADGLVDAKVVPDDTPRFMEKMMPTLNPADQYETTRITVVVTEIVSVAG